MKAHDDLRMSSNIATFWCLKLSKYVSVPVVFLYGISYPLVYRSAIVRASLVLPQPVPPAI